MQPMFAVITVLLALMVTSVCFAAPTLTSPATTSVGAGSATLVLQSGATGRGYFTLLSGYNADCGTGVNVKAGQTSSGAVAPYFGSLSLTADVAGNYTIRNLSGATDYTICFTADSPPGADLNPVPVATNFSTIAATAFTSSGWSIVGGSGFSPGGVANSTSLAFAPNGAPYVAYADTGNGDKATVMKYDAAPWSLVGSTGFSAGSASSPSLAFAPDGTPYITFGGDDYNSASVSVMMFDGNDWISVGSASLPADPVGYTSLAIGPDGAPHVAYADYSIASGGKITVIKFSDGAWTTLGDAGFTAFDAAFISLAIAPDGQPYVAYSDYGNVGMATVMKYSAGEWTVVGGAGFSASTANATSLAIAPDGTPHVAYRDDGNDSKATVMAYKAGTWTAMGKAGFSASGADFTSLAIAPDGTPYVAYQDWANSSKATVMRYGDGSWHTVGSAGFSASDAYSPFLAIAPDGTPYVVYQDWAVGSKATVMKLINLAPTISGTPPETANVGVAYSFTPTVTYAESFSFTGTLPPGLGLNPINGTLSGTPTTAGIYGNIVITATNSAGSASLPTFTITVADTPDTSITSAPANPDTSAAFSLSFTATVPGSTFECSLSGSTFFTCTSPYANSIPQCATCRSDTLMSFAVRAKGPSGNSDPTPATTAWTINQTAGNLIANVADSGVVQLQAAVFSENLNINRPGIGFSLQGGYDAGYLTKNGLTTIYGTVTIAAGTVTFENIAIF